MSKAKSRGAKGSNKGETDFFQLPENLLSLAFHSIGYRKVGNEIEVSYKLLLPPGDVWTTVVAVDASESMRSHLGRVLTGDIPPAVQERYYSQNLVLEETREGKTVLLYQPQAYENALASGYLKWAPNAVEPLARRVMEFLAEHVDRRKACNLLYLSCDGTPGVADLGEVPLADCSTYAVEGPPTDFGRESRLLPSIRYLADKFSGTSKTLVVILTDGSFTDLQDVKDYSGVFAQLMRVGQKSGMRFQLLGIGKEVSPQHLVELTDSSIPGYSGLWSYRHANEPGEFRQLLHTLMEEDRHPLSGVTILSADGQVLKDFPNGFPPQGTFRLPGTLTSFSLKVPSESAPIEQSLLLPFHKTLEV